jgi:hypothetical protein
MGLRHSFCSFNTVDRTRPVTRSHPPKLSLESHEYAVKMPAIAEAGSNIGVVGFM